MNSAPLDLKTAMLDRIRADAPRKVWTPGDFVDLASRDAIDKALQRLTMAETLRRIDRGLYDQLASTSSPRKPTRPIHARSSTPSGDATKPECLSTA